VTHYSVPRLSPRLNVPTRSSINSKFQQEKLLISPMRGTAPEFAIETPKIISSSNRPKSIRPFAYLLRRLRRSSWQSARFCCQGSPLRPDEREPHVTLAARTARRWGPLGGALLLFFKRKLRLKKEEERKSKNARKTTCHLGRTLARCGRKARSNACSLHRISQLLIRECLACARTVRSTQLAARTTQHLPRLA